MNINKNTEPISTNVHYGEGLEYDRNALKAYKCENELKKAVKEDFKELRQYLFTKYEIPYSFQVKMSEPGENPIIENFSIIELINSKLTSCNTTVCLSTYEIFKEKGIKEAIGSLHQFSNLTII